MSDGRGHLEQTQKLVATLNLLFRSVIQSFFEIRALSSTALLTGT